MTTYTISTQKIHNEVLELCANTLSKMKEVLSEYKKFRQTDFSKSERLRDLGFYHTPEARIYYNERDRIDSLLSPYKEKTFVNASNLIKKYETNILSDILILSKTELENICTKYNLKWGQIRFFKESIPQENLSKITYGGNLSIIAPSEMFVDGSPTEEEAKNDDPIIVRFLMDCESETYYEVVTMWGKEQAIPEIQNYRLN